MPIIPVGEWLPDLPAFRNPGSITATNVVPLTPQSYGPFLAPVAPYVNATLSSRCFGFYTFHDPSLNSYNFAGDATHLYLLENGSSSFVDVSKSGGSSSLSVGGGDVLSVGGGDALSTGGAQAGTYQVNLNYFWDSCAFGNNVIFTDFNDPIQSFEVGVSSTFDDLSSTAPFARYCATIRDFLMVGYTSDGITVSPYRVQWSAVGNPANWPTPGTNAAIEVQSDYQDLEQTDLGVVTGIIGNGLLGADGAAFCERGIYRILYVGSPAVFDFQVSQGGVGTTSPLSIASNRGIAYYVGPDMRFYAFDGANPSVPIGGNKVDNFFKSDADPNYIRDVIVEVDPVRPIVWWAYSAPNASSPGLYNKMLGYNWLLNRWCLVDITGQEVEWLAQTLTLGYSLDQLDAFGDLDTLPYPLDSPFWTGGAYVLSGFDITHKLVTFGGQNLAATVDTTESQPFLDRRAKVTMARPVIDSATASIAIAGRNNAYDPVIFGPAVPVNTLGWSPQMTEGRYLRGRITLPSGSSFTYLQGIDAEIKPRGGLR